MGDEYHELTSITLSEVVSRLTASRWLLPAFGATGLAIGVVLFLLMPRTYVSEATLLPSSGDDQPALSGNLLSLAGTLGISLPGSSVPESRLYPPILKSERILRNALDTRIEPGVPSEGTLLDVVKDDGRPEETRIEHAAEHLRREVLRVSLDEETGIVKIAVRMNDPVLANRTTEIFLHELSTYLTRERTAHARQNREFVEGRMAEAEEELARIEEEVRAFREANRKINNSPELLLEEDRLLREMRVQEEVYLELSRQYEIAFIEEQKATPVLEILDPPTIRFVPQSPRLPVFGGVGLLAGLFLGSLVALLFENPVARARAALSLPRGSRLALRR